jgi:hypothetical protein
MSQVRFPRLARLACCSVMLGTLANATFAEESRRGDRDRLPQPVYKVTERLENPVENNNVGPGQPANAEHPLAPVIQMAKENLAHMKANIKDYSATLVKKERVGDTINEQEFLFVKIRQSPFSVYTYFLGPARKKGQEAIYVEGKNNGNIVGHGVGIQKVVGTVKLPPLGMLAMRDNKYPITEIGLFNLTEKLIEIGEQDMKFGECEVKTIRGTKIDGRSCTCIEVVHPVPRKNFRFHKARVFYDDELQIITRYEAYDWPIEAGGQPILNEEYTYVKLKINNGFTDADFDENNPAYGYR